jgi:hypothetical protein
MPVVTPTLLAFRLPGPGPSLLLLTLLLAAQCHLATADTRVQHSYSERLEDSIYSFLAGCCLLIFSLCLLVSTERQAIVYDVLLDRCQQATIIINDNSSIDSLNENKPVFLRGETYLEKSDASAAATALATDGKETSTDTGTGGLVNILDTDTGYRCCPPAPLPSPQLALRLRRRVEMYQWVEHKQEKQEKGTVYSYTLEWRQSDVSSAHFQKRHGHHNPPRSPALSSTLLLHSAEVMVGAYRLAPAQLDLMQRYIRCPIPPSSLQHHSSLPPPRVEQESDWGSGPAQGQEGQEQGQTDFLVFGGSLQHPQPGTVRVSYEALLEGGEVSLVGVQCQLQHHQHQDQEEEEEEGRGRAGLPPPFRAFLPRDAQALQPWFLTALMQALDGDCSCSYSAPPSYSSAGTSADENYELDSRDVQSSGVCCGSVCFLPCQLCCCCCAALSACANVFSREVAGEAVHLNR